MSANGWRFTVTQKIMAGLAVIIVIGMLSMLQIYRGLNIVRTDVRKLAAVEAPLNAAAYEMEVNVNGIGLAALKYLATGNPRYRALVEEDQVDFANYHATYMRLIRTERERALGADIMRLYAPFAHLSRDLMDSRDRQEAMFAQVGGRLEAIDAIIDNRLQSSLPGFATQDAEAHDKAIAIADVEAEAAEIGFRVAGYQRRAGPTARRFILDKLDEFRGALARWRQLDLTAGEGREAARLQVLSDAIAEPIDALIALDDQIIDKRQRFLDRRVAMDRIFDGQLQPLALRGLEAPRREAERAARQVLATMRFLIPLYVLAAVVIGWLLIALITRPLTRLRGGTEAIGRGDLDHRVGIAENDEFGDLAGHFDAMAARLQATTVSRALLQQSEQELKATVTRLLHEKGEREALQAELRRTETMSAMGELVAGVAHEVRNPLFGISSTLDAMKARLGDRAEYRRYLEVLDGQVSRLGKLMGDLLDYGRPVLADLAPGSVREVVARAAEACAPLAERLGVRLRVDAPAALPAVAMDEGRLTQVFQNLIENALQHSPAGATVVLSLAAAGGYPPTSVECVVADLGPGFDDDDLPRLFEPFFTRRPRGTGLGLAIAQRIVDEHGGRIAASNRSGGGAMVLVELPVAAGRLSRPGQNA